MLASWLRGRDEPCCLVLEGPAVAAFADLVDLHPCVSLADAVASCRQVLTGSSWQSTLERRAIKAARASGKPSITYLDHWVHYRERFLLEGQLVLPDLLWVGDESAAERVREAFPGHPCRLVPNPWFAAVAQRFAREEPRPTGESSGLRILFVCEPLREHGRTGWGDERHWGYDEFEALAYFLDHRACLGPWPHDVVVRPHPSEPPDKYDAVIAAAGPGVRRGGARPLLDEIAAADVVVGCESMAMVAGLIAGRRVLHAIPPGGRACSLPHSGILAMRDLLPSG